MRRYLGQHYGLTNLLKPRLSQYPHLEKISSRDLTTRGISTIDKQLRTLRPHLILAFPTEVVSLKARPSYPDINQLIELLVTSLKPGVSKLLASHDFSSCLSTELKDLPSKITYLSGDVKELKKHEKLKTLDSLPSLLNKVTDTLNRFSIVVENASRATGKSVPSAGLATASPAEREKNTIPATKDAETINLHNELVDLLGIDVVTQYYNKKLLYDKYCDKMLKIRKRSKIINCHVITQKGPITLQLYREDGAIEVISNVKVSDLHLAE
ncbi:hypothetical protein Tco_0465168 [Tanacetum coccineum]